MSRHCWTPSEISMLLSMYAEHTAPEIAAAIGGVTDRQVYSKAIQLGLKKTPEWIRERARKAMEDPSHPGRKTYFQPGQKSWNTGTRGVMKRNSGSFKPGLLPHTWRPIGTDRVTEEGYRQRKIAETGCSRRDYVGIHHLVWRMHGHHVPAGHALIFKDGDKTNVDINNLELITRSELMRRNSVHRWGPEIQQLTQLKGAITRQINNRMRSEA